MDITPFLQKIRNKISSPLFIGWVYALSAAVIGAQHYWRDSFNNYKIFAAAFGHLKNGINLHEAAGEHFDIFLYAPPAAIFLAPLHYLPLFAGILIWAISSAMVVFYAIYLLPIRPTSKVVMWWVVWLELLTALHNLQTNPWLLAFGLLTLVYYERGAGGRAAAFPILGFFIKGFGGVGGFLLFFYDRFWRNSFAYVFWLLVLGATPALIVGFSGLLPLYQNWLACLAADSVDTAKEVHLMSLMHLLQAFWGAELNFGAIQIGGLIGLFGFLIYTRLFKQNTICLRLQVLAYLLMWSILFNHAAESNTHVISVGGAALWYASVEQSTRLDKCLLASVVLLTCLGETDLFPRFLRERYIFVYALKALPITLVWLKLQYDVITQHATA